MLVQVFLGEGNKGLPSFSYLMQYKLRNKNDDPPHELMVDPPNNPLQDNEKR